MSISLDPIICKLYSIDVLKKIKKKYIICIEEYIGIEVHQAHRINTSHQQHIRLCSDVEKILIKHIRFIFSRYYPKVSINANDIFFIFLSVHKASHAALTY